MTHYHVLLALPADVELTDEPFHAAIASALAPYNKLTPIESIVEDGVERWGNPTGKLDRYRIGGYEYGSYLPLRAGAAAADTIRGAVGYHSDPTYSDGGRIRALDFERKRAELAEEAGSDWDEYSTVVAGTPPHRPWTEFRDRPEYTIAQAHREYRAQPRVAAIHAHRPYQGQLLVGLWPEDIIGDLDRDTYIQQCRDGAIPGWATLTHDGRWLAPASTPGPGDETPESFDAYLAEANAYLDTLPGDMSLVALDCHI